MSWCLKCESVTLWWHFEIPERDGMPKSRWYMVHPQRSGAPPANPDLPDDIAKDYKEAAATLSASARASAALLRLCVQKLCKHFGQPGKNINDDIAALVKAGTIRPMIQQAMDVVRIAGNEAVHPGELNIDDDPELALELFAFVNLIADEAISGPARATAMYERMPKAKLDAVAQRDGTT